MSLGMAVSPQLRGPEHLQVPFPWVARGTCQNPLDEVLTVSGAYGRKDMGGLSPPWHGTVLVPPHHGLERPRAAPGVPGVRGTVTSAGVKLYKQVPPCNLSFASQLISKVAAFHRVSEALQQWWMKVESREL